MADFTKEEVLVPAERIDQILSKYRELEPEDAESWQSWYLAAFDMAADEIRRLLASAPPPPAREIGEDR